MEILVETYVPHGEASSAELPGAAATGAGTRPGPERRVPSLYA